MCNCKVCKLSRCIEKIKVKLSPRDAGIIEELEQREEMYSTEASRLDAKLRGTWPPDQDRLLEQAAVLGKRSA